MQYLFIVSVGRSGSTLLQNMLNSLEKVKILGENGIVLPIASGLSNLYHGWEFALSTLPSKDQHQYGFTSNLKSQRKKLGAFLLDKSKSTQPSHPWYEIHKVDPLELSTKMRELVLKDILFSDGHYDVFGFKEIRWHEYRNVFFGMDFMFPNAKYVFNFRSSHSISQSGWWNEQQDSFQKIEFAQEWMREEAAKLGERALKLDYESFSKENDQLKSLEKFISKRFNFAKLDEIRKLQLNH